MTSLITKDKLSTQQMNEMKDAFALFELRLLCFLLTFITVKMEMEKSVWKNLEQFCQIWGSTLQHKI